MNKNMLVNDRKSRDRVSNRETRTSDQMTIRQSEKNKYSFITARIPICRMPENAQIGYLLDIMMIER